jgi:glycosyltransferase involved in cell wall biosynthesis
MKQFEPDISVIIPCFNVEPYIATTLVSVLEQSYPPYEVILIDDGSRDRTPAIIEDFAARHSRIKVITLRPNQGVVAARNAGLAVARGTYVAMLDADDIWTPDALAKRVALAARFSQADVIATDFAWLQDDYQSPDATGRVGLGPRGAQAFADSFKTRQPTLLTSPFEVVATIHFAWTGATLVRRGAMNAVGNFVPEFDGPEDTLLWLRLANRGAFVFSPEVTAFYRQREGSLVTTLKGPKELHYLKVLHWIQRQSEFSHHKSTISKLIAECHHVSATHYWRAGDRKAALKHAFRAVRKQPVNLGYWKNVLTWNS